MCQERIIKTAASRLRAAQWEGRDKGTGTSMSLQAFRARVQAALPAVLRASHQHLRFSQETGSQLPGASPRAPRLHSPWNSGACSTTRACRTPHLSCSMALQMSRGTHVLSPQREAVQRQRAVTSSGREIPSAEPRGEGEPRPLGGGSSLQTPPAVPETAQGLLCPSP